jgi:Calcineurin-like phosphoesterase
VNRAALLLALLLLLPGPATAALRFGPYLQHTGSGEMTVCVYEEPGDRITAELLDPPGPPLTATGSQPACATFTALAGDREYRYRISVNGAPLGDEPATFVTPGDVQTFAIYGDTRSGDDSFDLAHGQVVQTLRETVVPDAIIHTGDFVEYGNRLSLWRSFFLIESPLLPATPIYPAIGRSDQPPELVRRLFPLLRESPWYSVDRGDVHLAVTHLRETSRQPDRDIAPDGEQARWLRADLAAARARGARHLLVVIHEPPLGPRGNSPPALRDVFMPILDSFGVTAVFSGAHYFSHAVRGSVHYLTNGGGGAQLDTRPAAEGVFLHFSPIHHFLVLETGSFGARLKAVSTSGEEFYAATLSGSDAVSPAAAGFVDHIPGGPRTAAVDVFFAGPDELAPLRAALPAWAEAAGASLAVNYRSLEHADNRAALEARVPDPSTLPVAIVGDRVFSGPGEIAAGLPDALLAAAIDQTPPGEPLRGLLLAGIALAAIVLVVAALRLRKTRA